MNRNESLRVRTVLAATAAAMILAMVLPNVVFAGIQGP